MSAKAHSSLPQLQAVVDSKDMLESFAVSVRPGSTCQAQPPAADDLAAWGKFAGGFHVHVPLSLSDGSEWLARIRLELHTVVPNGLKCALSESDYATVAALRRVASEWVPLAYKPPRQSQGDLHYFMSEMASGTSAHRMLHVADNEQQMRNLIRDVAQFYIKVSTLPFRGIGSPTVANAIGNDGTMLDASSVEVGPWLTYPGAYHSAFPEGPYPTSRLAYTAKIDHLLSLIERNKLGHELPDDDQAFMYLAFLETRALIQDCTEMAIEGPTYIRHGDDKSDVFLVHDDGSLSAVLDWEL